MNAVRHPKKKLLHAVMISRRLGDSTHPAKLTPFPTLAAGGREVRRAA
jgi:hypothetical protein